MSEPPPMSDPPPTGDPPPEGYFPIASTNPFARPLGPIYERAGADGFARGLRLRMDHCNAAGTAHGGLLMTFADIVLARAVSLATGAAAITMRLSTEFVAPARPGEWLEGEARVTSLDGDRAAVCGEIRADGRLVARADGRFKVRPENRSRPARATAGGRLRASSNG